MNELKIMKGFEVVSFSSGLSTGKCNHTRIAKLQFLTAELNSNKKVTAIAATQSFSYQMMREPKQEIEFLPYIFV